jgi:hypothetical protein
LDYHELGIDVLDEGFVFVETEHGGLEGAVEEEAKGDLVGTQRKTLMASL